MVSILTTIRMAISILVEAFLSGGIDGKAGKPPPKDEKGAKE